MGVPDTVDHAWFLVNTEKWTPTPRDKIVQLLQSKSASDKAAGLQDVMLSRSAGEPLAGIVMVVIQYCINCDDKRVQKLLMLFWEMTRKQDEKGALLPEMILVWYVYLGQLRHRVPPLTHSPTSWQAARWDASPSRRPAHPCCHLYPPPHSNAMRNLLIHPNEYMRGCALRFLCKIKERDLLEPLVPSVKQCLTHRHPYVRRAAIFTVRHIFMLHGDDLMPDGPELATTFLTEETDANARRNGFAALIDMSRPAALQWFSTVADRVSSLGAAFALTVLDTARRCARESPADKHYFIRPILQLLHSDNDAVKFEAGHTLISVTAAPTAVRAAAACFTELLADTGDNSVKLVVLDRLYTLRSAGHGKVMRELVMDLLKAVPSRSIAVRTRALELALSLVNSRSVAGVVAWLKKEVNSASQGLSEDPEYRNAIVTALHDLAVKWPEHADTVVFTLLDNLSGNSGKRIIEFVRQIPARFPALAPEVLARLQAALPTLSSVTIVRTILWVLGQYSETPEALSASFSAIKTAVGSLPLVPDAEQGDAAEAAGEAADGAATPKSVKSTSARVLADGTYASAPVAMESSSAGERDARLEALTHSLRTFLLEANWFIAAVLSSTLAKLALRALEVHGPASRAGKSVAADALLLMTAVVQLGVSGKATPPTRGKRRGPRTDACIDQDAYERIAQSMRLVADRACMSSVGTGLLAACDKALSNVMTHSRDEGKAASAAASTTPSILSGKWAGLLAAAAAAGGAGSSDVAEVTATAHGSPDDAVHVRHLRGLGQAADTAMLLEDDVSELAAAVQSSSASADQIVALSGVSDPVFVEAHISRHDFDIALRLTLRNATSQLLTQVQVELAATGSVKLVERPYPQTLSPGETATVNATLKVTSLDTGVIHGTLSYMPARGSDSIAVNLGAVTVSVMDYIQPGTVDDAAFRRMWAEFEWENKVLVHTDITDLREFVHHIAAATHTKILTPLPAAAAVPFLAANLYAKSSFGDHALLNISLQLKKDGQIKGHVRIRAKTQGVALTLGDRVSAMQKHTSLV